jgi:hypothetical protein
MGSTILQVKNRTSKDFEFTCDGQVHIVPAHDVVALPDYIAHHGISKSMVSLDPYSNDATYALCLASADDAEEEIEAKSPDQELLVREPDDEAKPIKFKNPDAPKARITSALG